MKSMWRFFSFYGLVFILMVVSCQSILNTGTEIEIYEEVANEIMPLDPLLFQFHASKGFVNHIGHGSLYSAELTQQEITEKANDLLSKSKECRANKVSFDPDLESVIFYLEHLVNRDSFALHHYPITSNHGLHLDVLMHFSSRSLSTKKNVESYLDELSVIDQRFKNLIDELELRRKNGIVAPSNILKAVRQTCDSIVLIPVDNHPIYLTYSQKLDSIGLMEPSKKDAYIKSCKEVLLESVIPAYVRLSNYLAQLEETSLNVVGVWRFTNGDEFYQHCLNWHTGINLSVDSIYAVAKSELSHLEGRINEPEELELEFGINYSTQPQFRKALPIKAHQLGYKLFNLRENKTGINEDRLATAKLIVDIGIHQKRWLRDQAVQYLTAKANIELEYAERIADKSISNPGLIGTEKVGQLVLKKLRNQNLDLSDYEFKKAVTQNGPLPLGVLSRMISVKTFQANSR